MNNSGKETERILWIICEKNFNMNLILTCNINIWVAGWRYPLSTGEVRRFLPFVSLRDTCGQGGVPGLPALIRVSEVMGVGDGYFWRGTWCYNSQCWLSRLEPGIGSPYFGKWLGKGWGKDSQPYFLRQFYPNNPRPNNGNKRKNARTETVSAVRSRMQSPGWISSQSITAVTLTLSKILTSNTSTRGFCNNKSHFWWLLLVLMLMSSRNQSMICQQLLKWPKGCSVSGLTEGLFTTKESTVRLLSSRPNPLL